MNISTMTNQGLFHPSYENSIEMWNKISDVNGGEDTVKSKKTKYLPPTPGVENDLKNSITKALAQNRYDRYLFNAIFYNYFNDTVDGIVGIMNSNPPDTIELPSSMQYLKDNCNPDNTGINSLILDINKQQTTIGRVGMLLDPTENGYKILQYNTSNIVNWGSSYIDGVEVLDFVLLDESTMVRNGFVYEEIEKYRLCALDQYGKYYSTIILKEQLEDFDILNPKIEVVYPLVKGNISKEIPFVFVNVSNLKSSIENPPLLNLANICLHIYTGEAIYRQFLFGTSQDTLFLKGFHSDELDVIRTGGGSMIATTQADADVKYVGITATGLTENRESLQNLHRQAASVGLASIGDSNRVESGYSLSIRTQIKTSPLRIISATGAEGVENIFKIGARWEGLNDQDVKIVANTDFTNTQLTIDDTVKLWKENLPISDESIHKQLVQSNATDKTFEQEQQEIDKQQVDQTV